MDPEDKQNKLFFKYSEEHLKCAVEAVQIGGSSSMRKAAKNYGIPFSTLNNKVKGKVPVGHKMGPSSILSNAEETLLSVKPHVPLIRFRKGGLSASGSGGAAKSRQVSSRPVIEDYQLPLRYRRQPIDQKEIDYINYIDFDVKVPN
ncbi:hypothetical protein C0J52_09895 [Blattella germanica]|nr:hypothetical protein C0J52_09895 [Blattella germanica]